MFGLGPTELIVILVLALLVLGPKRIPEAASTLGKAIRGFRRATKELKDQIDIDDEVRRPFEDLRSALRDEPLRPVYPPLITSPPEETFPRVPIDETPAATVPAGGAASAALPSTDPATGAAVAPAPAPVSASAAAPAPAAAPPPAHAAAEHTK
jgi:sec-independent protein translocase protein TatB